MSNIEKIKVKNIDLEVSESIALIILIDDFRFIWEKGSCFVDIEIENQGSYEKLDEIYLDSDYLLNHMCLIDLKKIALNWLFNHVEII